jgi:cytochrome c biogenesis protein CcmG/thiol:disulfide interchange protein DsbE
MKIILSITLATIISFGFKSDTLSKKLPDITIADLKGKPVRIIDYIQPGKTTIISFWATWCAPCKRELDAIADLYPVWQEDYGAQLVAITIDNARALTQVKPLITEKGWEYEFLVDAKEELKQALNFQAIPQTFIVDGEGNIVYQHEGYNPGDELEVEKIIKQLAGK